MSSIITFAKVTQISKPFNANQTVEIKLKCDSIPVELYWRVDKDNATKYELGDTYAIHLQKVFG